VVIGNMLAGYASVDALVASGIDLFALGSSRHLLELNTLVLCGTSPARRATYARHIAATEQRFYDERHGGVRDLVEWQAQHKDESPWTLAAGAHVQILSKPQLFIEGNHRTGALVMSYLLVRDGEPPFVLTLENAPAYFDIFRTLRDTDKNSPTMLFRLLGARKRLGALLREQSDRHYLLD
jgi:prophage maintenance system killer protein